jgi:hypothetical protein
VWVPGAQIVAANARGDNSHLGYWRIGKCSKPRRLCGFYPRQRSALVEIDRIEIETIRPDRGARGPPCKS